MEINMRKDNLKELGFDESLNDENFRYRYNLESGIFKGRLFLGFSLAVFTVLWVLNS
jgi:hypothetical protein